MQSDRSSETSSPSPPSGEADLIAMERSPAIDSDATPPSGRVVVALTDEPRTPPDDKTVITQRPARGDSTPPVLATPEHIGQMLIGKTLDHYELVEFVGGGGMGAVFRANDTRLGRTVAVKVLSRDQSDEETIRRFRNEAQSAARLDHPNIARVYFVGEANGLNYIVFEFIEGVNLRDLVDERGPLPLEDALHYTLQVAEALAHSSSRDVVHRDIKPSNVLITAEGQAKLVDMGLARLHQVESSSDDLTASGVTLGTFDYISPEQARDPRAADVRSDIYSLGCTLYYMLTGQPPFPDGTALQKLLRHNAEEPPDVRLFRPELSPAVTALMGKMLAKRPSQRQQNSEQLIADVLALAQQLGLSTVKLRGQVVLPVAADQGQWRNSAWQIVLAAAVLATAVIVVDAMLPAGGGAEVSRRPKLAARPAAVSEPAKSPPLISPPPGPAEAPSAPAASGVSTTVPIARSEPNSGTPNADTLNAGTLNSGTPNSGTPNSGTPNVGETKVPGENSPASSPMPAAGSIANVAAPPLNNVAAATDQPTPAAAPPSTEVAVSPPEIEAAVELAPAEYELALAPEPAAVLEAPELPIAVSRLVVADEVPELLPPQTEFVSTLAAACRRAAELGLSEIELQWNGPRIQQPLDITSPRLTIRAAAGYRPIVVFRPEGSGLASERQMIKLSAAGTSRLVIQGAELRLQLPVVPSDSWSLIAMQAGETLELADCVLTVQNDDERHALVAMIAVQGRRVSETMTMGQPQPAMVAPTRVSFDRCIARGAATVIAMQDETPLTIRFTQGLIATPWRFMETGGSVNDPTLFEGISLTFDHVTASCRQGLYQMKRRPGSGHQLAVNVVTDHCILTADAQSPLYEFVGVSAISQDDLQCQGQSNLFPNPKTVFLRRRGERTDEAPEEFSIEKRGLIWSKEVNPQAGEPWHTRPDFSTPAHRFTLADFQVNPAMISDVGFDGDLLPPAAAEEPLPAEPAADQNPPAASADEASD